LRLIKNNTLNYEPFQRSLQYYSSADEHMQGLKLLKLQNEKSRTNLLEKYAYMFHTIAEFESRISKIEDYQSMNRLLYNSMKRIMPLKAVNVFFFDEEAIHLVPVEDNCIETITTYMNNSYKEGMFDWIFDTGNPLLLPLPESRRNASTKLNFLVLPLKDGDTRKGIVALLTSLGSVSPEDMDVKVVNIMIGMSFSKIESLYSREKLKSTLNELQTYQAKLANDFKLSAIGELTDGIVEEIIDPLQVILSFVDLSNSNNQDKSSTNLIRAQVQKIEKVINRLVKFASIDSESIKIEPCYINNIIRDYMNLVKSYLEGLNIECILDLEKDLPPVLSHPNLLYQLLTNLFSMIKTHSKKGAGMFIQSRFVDDKIVLKIVTTSFLRNILEYTNDNMAKSRDLNLNIINDLMKKHEGEFKAVTDAQKGSTMILSFPLKRKIRR